MRMLRMSKVPIAAQPSLSAKAIGTRPSAFILSPSALSSSRVFGDVVAVLLPDALAVEHRPRVVGGRHEELLAVVLGRAGLLEALGDAGRSPGTRR